MNWSRAWTHSAFSCTNLSSTDMQVILFCKITNSKHNTTINGTLNYSVTSKTVTLTTPQLPTLDYCSVGVSTIILRWLTILITVTFQKYNAESTRDLIPRLKIPSYHILLIYWFLWPQELSFKKQVWQKTQEMHDVYIRKINNEVLVLYLISMKI